MSYVRGTDRWQVQLLPPSVEDYVDARLPFASWMRLSMAST